MNVLMPQLGETVTEGTISKWYKSVGDTVNAGELLLEIETDKTSMEVPAIGSGILTEIRAQAGETVPVGGIISVLSETGAAAEARPSDEASTKPAPAGGAGAGPAAVAIVATAARPPARALDPFNAVRSPERNFGPATLANGTKVTPLARRLAVELGKDLVQIKGSGPYGRIVAADIRNAQVATSASRPVPGGTDPSNVKALYAGIAYREIPLDGMRRTIARRLVESTQTVPHFYVTTDVSVDALLSIRKQVNASGRLQVSINDCIVKAYALALQDVPAANAAWAEDRLLQFDNVDVGVAVAVEGGLITPVVRNANIKPLGAVSAEIGELVARARDRKLKPAEYQGGTATVSNLGMYGVREFAAIINPPQATILAVGAAERRPIENADGSIAFASRLTVTLSVDHRVVDGAVAGKLLAAFKRVVESPVLLLI